MTSCQSTDDRVVYARLRGGWERKVIEIVCRDKICLIFSYSYSYRESVPRDISEERIELTILERPW